MMEAVEQSREIEARETTETEQSQIFDATAVDTHTFIHQNVRVSSNCLAHTKAKIQ